MLSSVIDVGQILSNGLSHFFVVALLIHLPLGGAATSHLWIRLMTTSFVHQRRLLQCITRRYRPCPARPTSG